MLLWLFELFIYDFYFDVHAFIHEVEHNKLIGFQGDHDACFGTNCNSIKFEGYSKNHTPNHVTYEVADTATSYSGEFSHSKAKALVTSAKEAQHEKNSHRRNDREEKSSSRPVPIEKYYLTTEEKMLSEAHRQDLGRCGERLVCEVSASARTRHLTVLEREILQFVR